MQLPLRTQKQTVTWKASLWHKKRESLVQTHLPAVGLRKHVCCSVGICFAEAHIKDGRMTRHVGAPQPTEHLFALSAPASCEARCPAATYIATLWLQGEE